LQQWDRTDVPFPAPTAQEISRSASAESVARSPTHHPATAVNKPKERTSSASDTAAPRRTWQAPRVTELPRLTELTLQTGNSIPGGGGTGGGGSTVF
jgi:hypothetical protein